MSHRTMFTIAGVAAIVLVLASRSWREHQAAHQPLQVPRVDLDLGQVWLSDKLEHKFTVRNVSDRLISIAAFDTSCDCSAVTPSYMQLAPFSSDSVNITIDMRRIVRRDISAGIWPISIDVQARVDDRSISPKWQFHGKIISPLEKLPEQTSEPPHLSKVEAATPFLVSVRPKHGIVYQGVSSGVQGLTCRIITTESESDFIEFLIDPAMIDSGAFLARASLHLRELETGAALSPFPLELGVVVTPIVVAQPAVVLIQRLDSPVMVSLSSACNRPFTVLEVGKCDGLDVTLLPVEDDHCDRQVLRIAATKPDDTMSLVPLHVDVMAKGSDARERVLIRIQRPIGYIQSSFDAE